MPISVAFAAWIILSCLLGRISNPFSPQEITKTKGSMAVMSIQLIKKCPNCGHDDLYRIPRKWYMRLILFTKRYHCKACRSSFVVNFWAAIMLIPIILPWRLFILILWRLSGLSLLRQKMHLPVFGSEEKSRRVLNSH